MGTPKNTVTREGIPALVKGRRYLTISCKGRTSIQLLSKRKDGSVFEVREQCRRHPFDPSTVEDS